MTLEEALFLELGPIRSGPEYEVRKAELADTACPACGHVKGTHAAPFCPLGGKEYGDRE